MKIQLFAMAALLSSAFNFQAHAKQDTSDLKRVFQKLSKTPLLTLSVEKKTKSELLGTQLTSPGTIYISDEKFRWDTEGKEKSRIIFDGKTVWTIQDPPAGFKIPPQITKMKLDKKSEGQLILKSLFTNEFDSQFIVVKKMKMKSDMVYKLAPIKKDSIFTELEVRVGPEGKLSEIAYIDEVQNKIQVMINKISKSDKKNIKLFEYKPPVGAQVTEI